MGSERATAWTGTGTNMLADRGLIPSLCVKLIVVVTAWPAAAAAHILEQSALRSPETDRSAGAATSPRERRSHTDEYTYVRTGRTSRDGTGSDTHEY